MSPINATALRIAAFIGRHPDTTKHKIAVALKVADSTVEAYIGPLKAAGHIEADKRQPPRYRSAENAVVDESTSVVVSAMRAMCEVGHGEVA